MDDKQIDFLKNIAFKMNTGRPMAEYEKMNFRHVMNEVNMSADIPSRFANVTCDMFDLSFDVAEFSCRKDNDKICLIVGTVGQGKTTTLCCAIHQRAIEGLAAGYYMSDMMLDVRLRSLRSFSSKETEFDFYKRMGSAPFLCIDEVGTSGNAEEERTFIRRLLCMRYDNKLPTMIATNMTNSQFKKFLLGLNQVEDITIEELNERCKKDPVMDRLFSVVEPVTMAGEKSFRRS